MLLRSSFFFPFINFNLPGFIACDGTALFTEANAERVLKHLAKLDGRAFTNEGDCMVLEENELADNESFIAEEHIVDGKVMQLFPLHGVRYEVRDSWREVDLAFDSNDELKYHGFVKVGEQWNGWAVGYFTQKEFARLLTDLRDAGLYTEVIPPDVECDRSGFLTRVESSDPDIDDEDCYYTPFHCVALDKDLFCAAGFTLSVVENEEGEV